MDKPQFNLANLTSVHEVTTKALALVTTSVDVFAEDKDIQSMYLKDGHVIMPWGANNQMPYDILDKVQSDETVSTCLNFNTELMYGGGLKYKAKEDENGNEREKPATLKDFRKYNTNLSQEFLGSCLDMKYWGFCVNVIILNADGNYISTIERREAMNCRFQLADKNGVIHHVYYGNWRKYSNPDNVEVLTLLDMRHPLQDLETRMRRGEKRRKFAVVGMIPCANHYYYPIPQYGCIFRSRWFDIKQLVAVSKEAKLRNSAPLKYHVEIAKDYFINLANDNHITDQEEFQKMVAAKKKEIIEYLTGAENSGKAFFSSYLVTPDGKEQHDVKITRVDTGKEGGDWEQDYQEAVNTVCFALGVHSNLVGSVPGKAQTNNSGSDKRELYTIAQLRQRAYHDVLLGPHELVCRFNGWEHFHPVVPLMMLTTLDEHKDAKPMPEPNTDNTNANS